MTLGFTDWSIYDDWSYRWTLAFIPILDCRRNGYLFLFLSGYCSCCHRILLGCCRGCCCLMYGDLPGIDQLPVIPASSWILALLLFWIFGSDGLLAAWAGCPSFGDMVVVDAAVLLQFFWFGILLICGKLLLWSHLSGYSFPSSVFVLFRGFTVEVLTRPISPISWEASDWP